MRENCYENVNKYCVAADQRDSNLQRLRNTLQGTPSTLGGLRPHELNLEGIKRSGG